MIVYTGYKISILGGKKSIDIVQAVKENHFDDSHVFSAKQGLNIALGVFLTTNPSTHQPLDPSYGRVRFSKLQVQTSENGETNFQMAEIASHTCSAEELGLSGDDQKFFSIAES